MTIPQRDDIDCLLSPSNKNIHQTYSHLINSKLFIGPLTKKEANIEVNKYFEDTHPALLFKINNDYFCIYP